MMKVKMSMLRMPTMNLELRLGSLVCINSVYVMSFRSNVFFALPKAFETSK